MKSIIVSVVGLVALTISALNGHAQLNVANDGKIGIGTTSPSTSLEVNGDVKVSSTNTAKLGVGRQIGTWRNDLDVFGVGATSSIWGKRVGVEMNLSSNAIHDGAWKYMQSGNAVNVNLRGDGGFWVGTSISGTAGGSIDWKYPFKISHDGLITGEAVPSAMSNGMANGVAFDADGVANFGRHQNDTGPFMRYYNGTGLVGTLSANSNDLTLMSREGDMILGADNVKRLYVKKNGWTGINRAVPNAALDVGGSIALNGNVIHTSDRRFKKDIKVLSSTLDTIKELKGVSYQWRAEEYKDREWEKGTQLGFIAQEVEQVLPELVTTGKDGYKSVSYTQVIPVLVEATKELSAKVDSLEKRNTSLTSENKSLKKHLKASQAHQSAMLKRLERLERLALSRISDDVALNNQAMQPVAGENK